MNSTLQHMVKKFEQAQVEQRMRERKLPCPSCDRGDTLVVKITNRWHCNGCGRDFGDYIPQAQPRRDDALEQLESRKDKFDKEPTSSSMGAGSVAGKPSGKKWPK